MTVRLIMSLASSLALHAGLLFWSPGKEPVVLVIGGQAQALSVTLAKPSARASQPHEFATLEAVPAKPAAPRKVPAIATMPQTEITAPVAPGQVLRASATTTQHPSTRNSSLNVSKHISAALQNQLAKRFEYPWLARKRGWQGQVTLSLQVDSSGGLSHWQIAATSGHAVLDRSALKAAEAIQHLPEAENLLPGQALNLLIPVRYQLLDS